MPPPIATVELQTKGVDELAAGLERVQRQMENTARAEARVAGIVRERPGGGGPELRPGRGRPVAQRVESEETAREAARNAERNAGRRERSAAAAGGEGTAAAAPEPATSGGRGGGGRGKKGTATADGGDEGSERIFDTADLRRLHNLGAQERQRRRALEPAAIFGGDDREDLRAAERQGRRPVIRGTAYQLREAEAAVSSARSDDERHDAGERAERLRERLGREQEGGSFNKRLMDLIGSSRFSAGRVAGVDVMPLVSRLTALVPGLTRLIPVIGGVTGTLGALSESARQADEHLYRFSRARGMSGGSSGSVAALEAGGMDLGDVAGRAADVRSRITTDPLAQQLAARMGVGYPGPREFGDQDEAKILLQIRDGLRNILKRGDLTPDQRRSEQLRQARILGMDDQLEEINVSDRVNREQRRDATRRSQYRTPRDEQEARDLRAQEKRAWDNVGDAFRAIGDDLFRKPREAMARGIADFARQTAEDARELPYAMGWKKRSREELSKVQRETEFRRQEQARGLPEGSLSDGSGGGKGPRDQAMDANTRALLDLSSNLRHPIGLGPRGSGATPQLLGGEALRRAYEQNAGAIGGLGAFGDTF